MEQFCNLPKGYILLYNEDLVRFTCVMKFLKSRVSRQKSTGVDVLGRVMITYHRDITLSFADL